MIAPGGTMIDRNTIISSTNDSATTAAMNSSRRSEMRSEIAAGGGAATDRASACCGQRPGITSAPEPVHGVRGAVLRRRGRLGDHERVRPSALSRAGCTGSPASAAMAAVRPAIGAGRRWGQVDATTAYGRVNKPKPSTSRS